MTRKRAYVLRARGERLAETRRRIAQAAMELHQELGPRHTTISAIAERAGVERLTVYRHFPDDDALFAACSGRFAELHPPPDPAAWTAAADPWTRLPAALNAVYGYFGRTAPMLDKLYRDASDLPALARVMHPFDAYLSGVADDLAAAVRAGDARVSAVCRHALEFATWRSLESHGIDTTGKVALITTWLHALAAPSSGSPSPS